MFDSKEDSRYQRMLQSELERAIIEMKTDSITSEDYKKTLGIVERLHGMMDKTKPSSVSKDAVLMVAANLAGIVLIIAHEHVGNAVTSKALNFVIRSRI